MGDNFYLLSVLPALPEFGGEPPLTPGELREHAQVGRGTAALVETVLLSDDLLQRQAYLAGEIKEVEPNVLSVGQVKGEASLPVYLETQEEAGGAGGPMAGVDRLWEAYFRQGAAVGRRQGSGFLRAWVGYEVGLRNALARARAKALELDAAGYLVATDLAGEEDFGRLLSEWQVAETPLAGLELLDRARWQWLAENDAYFSFSDDELGAYAAKLMLLVRWRRMQRAARQMAQGEGPAEAGPTT